MIPNTSAPSRTLNIPLFADVTLRDCLTLLVCAALATASQARMPLHLPGHRLLGLAFFLLLGRALVTRRWAATSIACSSMLMTVALWGGGPEQMVKFVAAGVVADLVFAMFGQNRSVLASLLFGAAIGASWLPINLAAGLALGLDSGLVIRAALLKSAFAVGFGVVGGLLASPAVRRMRAAA